MKEASKTRAIRPSGFYDRFMKGTVLDIGAGDDLCVPHAVRFDKTEGDANDITAYHRPETFDCVHSSHCLEHMYDPVKCLKDWWSLVKPGGFLITIIPDEDLYEQGHWPSLFNSDHKSTFRLNGTTSWSPVSHSTEDLIKALPGALRVSVVRCDANYLHGKPLRLHSLRNLAYRASKRLARLERCDRIDSLLGHVAIRLAIAAGRPVDQTIGRALAQIEIIVQKERQSTTRRLAG